MMFGQFLILGSWIVTLATYLMASPLKGGLAFSPSFTNWIYSSLAVAGILCPLIVGLLADRLFAAQKLMAVLHLAGGGLLLVAGAWTMERQQAIAEAFRDAASAESIDGIPLLEADRRFDAAPDRATEDQRRLIKQAFDRVNASPAMASALGDTFYPLLAIMFLYSFCGVITITLSNVVAFRNLHDPQRSFGRVRLFGTIGWIVAGVQLELFWDTISSVPLFVAGSLSLVFAVYCLFLPHTPPIGNHKSLADAFGLPAFTMFRERAFCVLVGCTLGIAAVQQFYSIYTNRFLNELNVPYPAAVQTVAQVAEVCCMMLLPVVLVRFGLKWTMTFGLVCWIVRNAVFASNALPIVVGIGLPLHGISYAFFMIVASMFVDRQAPLRLRASAQAIYTCVSLGMGTLLGNWISAQVVQAHTIGDIVDWQTVWLVPAGISAAILVVFVAFFRESVAVPVHARVDSPR